MTSLAGSHSTQVGYAGELRGHQGTRRSQQGRCTGIKPARNREELSFTRVLVEELVGRKGQRGRLALACVRPGAAYGIDLGGR